MKNIYANHTADDLWLIKETEFVRELQGIRESQFALGNGYLGSRGVYEEIPYDAHAGTYIAGLYDQMAAQVSEMVNLPNPVNFQFSIEGEKLDPLAMDIIRHKRALNLKKAVLVRQTVFKDRKNRCYDYQSIRFLSGHDKNIGVMRIALTPLDGPCTIDINTGIDTSIANAGILSEGRKKHFRIKELGQYRNAGFLVCDTFEKKYTIVYWSGFYYQTDGKKIIAKDNIFRLKLKKNQTILFTKIFCIKHFPQREDHALQKTDAFKVFEKAWKSDFSDILKKHTDAWEKLWKKADIIIGGTANLQQNMRFNIYHMLICAHYDNGYSSIGARTLSGEGYRGHIFWDAEIFLLPFYVFTFPKVAKNMLLYRYRRLDASRQIAKFNGYKGAQFAWESGDTGEEETPEWARDFDKSIIKIYTHKMEHHITADVAYAICKYYTATGDEDFMEKAGYEMFIETARFWASRVQLNKKTKRYDINNVIGPDEFHVDVNNNAYTNMMAQWNLMTAARLVDKLKKKPKVYTALKEKLNFKETESHQWKHIASKIAVNKNKNKVIEEFDGYFKSKKVTLTKTDENGIPLIPTSIKAKDLSKTQIVKQADVLMLIHLLQEEFDQKTKLANWEYYFPRTVHKSSLSAPMHAFFACDVEDLHRAYNFFNVALRTDISNLYGNTPEGIHAASLGGTWQALVLGFAGIKIRKCELFIKPRMPRSWRKLSFSLMWRDDTLQLELTNDVIRVKVVSKKRKAIKLGIFNKLLTVKANKTQVFEKSVHEYPEEEYY